MNHAPVNTSFIDRTFQLWEYRVSHSSLLNRSPKSPGVSTNIDLICTGVEYLAVPRFRISENDGDIFESPFA
jgi:hypothetical protein